MPWTAGWLTLESYVHDAGIERAHTLALSFTLVLAVILIIRWARETPQAEAEGCLKEHAAMDMELDIGGREFT